jgi:hypothetical protein
MWGRSNELGEDGIGATLTGGLEPGEVVALELSLPLSAQPLFASWCDIVTACAMASNFWL